MTIYKASLNLISLLRKAKTIGGKYLKRWQVSNPKTGKMKWVYKYKPVSQRGAHEVTKNKFEKVTKLSGAEHKNAVEKALQSGNRVSLHVLRDYPDLVQKYGMGKRLERADKINAKVKAIREKNQTAEKNANEQVPAADNSSKGEQNKMNQSKKMQATVKGHILEGTEKEFKDLKDLLKLHKEIKEWSYVAYKNWQKSSQSKKLVNFHRRNERILDKLKNSKLLDDYSKIMGIVNWSVDATLA